MPLDSFEPDSSAGRPQEIAAQIVGMTGVMACAMLGDMAKEEDAQKS